jgi:chromosomal replication initiator protein
MRQDVQLSSTQDFVENSPLKKARESAPLTRDPIDGPENAKADFERKFSAEIRHQLAQRIGDDRFNMWFDGDQNFQVTNTPEKNVVVLADSQFTCQRIQNSLGRDIRLIVDRICGPQFKIEFSVVESEHSNVPDSKALDSKDSNAQSSDQSETLPLFTQTGQGKPDDACGESSNSSSESSKLISSSRAGSKQSGKLRGLNGFHFGENNPLIEKAVEQSFKNPGRYSPLFVYGSVGCGKSHLLESYTHDFRKRLRMSRCVYLTAEQFTGFFLHSLRGGSGLPVFRRKYRDLDLLAIDNIQFFAGKRATLNEFQYTIDHLIRSGKQVLLSADRPPVELHDMGSEVATRIAAGLVCSLDYPDYESRRRIVTQFCKPLGLDLDEEVINLVCQTLKRDVRKLSGAINRLSVLQSLHESRITTDQVRTTLADLFSTSCSSSTSMPNIEKAVCEIFEVKPSELKSASRRKQISSARMLAMYLSRRYTSSAFSEIGDYYGGRTHSTVIAAEKKVDQWVEQNEGIALPHARYSTREVIKRIESNLRIG